MKRLILMLTLSVSALSMDSVKTELTCECSGNPMTLEINMDTSEYRIKTILDNIVLIPSERKLIVNGKEEDFSKSENILKFSEHCLKYHSDTLKVKLDNN